HHARPPVLEQDEAKGSDPLKRAAIFRIRSSHFRSSFPTHVIIARRLRSLCGMLQLGSRPFRVKAFSVLRIDASGQGRSGKQFAPSVWTVTDGLR
ncbi:hypothetical protein, partial [Rhizobium leguminosarum]|uniref:hypothetical protein n=1 Tax=Rhizobium leguminosarum TaxID=384 RepID=UPI0019540F1D